jgi:LysM repeat protein
MSRRDTIIVAVLINVALLAVLFTTAVNTSEDEEESIVTKLSYEIPVRPGSSGQGPAPLVREETQQEEETGAEELAQNETAGQVTRPSTQPAPIAPSVRPVANVQTRDESSGSSPNRTVIVRRTRSEASPVQPSTVTVKKGDVLSRIAVAHGTSVEELMRENNLRSTTLRIGQVLKLPGRDSTVAVSAAPTHQAPAAPAQAGREYYEVQKGDSPWKIAREHGVALADLLKMNDLNEEKARRLRPGDRLRIR